VGRDDPVVLGEEVQLHIIDLEVAGVVKGDSFDQLSLGVEQIDRLFVDAAVLAAGGGVGSDLEVVHTPAIHRRKGKVGEAGDSGGRALLGREVIPVVARGS